MRRGHVFAAENQHTGAGARLAFPSCAADIKPGGWRWTSHSPTGSGPEGSSPNELRFGSLVSLPLVPARFGDARYRGSVSPIMQRALGAERSRVAAGNRMTQRAMPR